MSNTYQRNFLKRAQNLRHAGKSAGQKIEARNPMCGDQQVIYIETDGNTIKNISFEGSSCMVSKVATDLVAAELIGQNLDRAHKLEVDHIEKLMGIQLSPTRHECATLGLSAIKDAIKGER